METTTAHKKDVELHAWIDESMRDPKPGNRDGMYIVAAGVADPLQSDQSRTAMMRLLPKAATRLHWHAESAARQVQIARTISTLDVTLLVVVNTRYDGRRQERARRKCMERLLNELRSRGVTRAVIESRTDSLNRKDMEMVDALRSRGEMVGLHAGFDRPSAEPMLWIPDAVSGAVNGFRSGRRPAPLSLMGSRITIIHVGT